MAAMEAVIGFKVRIIVSTDVMARGVDFDRVNLVVNIDLPPDAATYVHRVGRTGRFGSRGIAVALVAQQELRKLQQYLSDVKGGEGLLHVKGWSGGVFPIYVASIMLITLTVGGWCVLSVFVFVSQALMNLNLLRVLPHPHS
jgi:hypothetical protein